MSTQLVLSAPPFAHGNHEQPPALFLPHAHAAERFWDFFTANVRNKHTRRAYYKAACRFSEWCEGRGVRDLADVKPMLLGHWGTTPGQNFIYVHLNRVIQKYDLDMFYVAGPGHGGPALVANTYLEGTYSEFYPNVSQDEAGLKKLFMQFSFPGGISSHVAPTTPGSIHEGGELGYSLSHAFGAAFDNPDLIVACVVGDGEAETGPLATAWQSNKFLNPVRDGTVLPILPSRRYCSTTARSSRRATSTTVRPRCNT